MSLVVTLTVLFLLLFAVMAYFLTHIDSMKVTESQALERPSEHQDANVSIRELLSLVGEAAAIPPHFPVNKSCVPEELPR